MSTTIELPTTTSTAPRSTSRVSILITDPEPGAPSHKLAGAELHFHGGLLDGLKLVGFGIWRVTDHAPNVTFPARHYGTGTGRRAFSLLRANGDGSPDVALRLVILDAYSRHRTSPVTPSI